MSQVMTTKGLVDRGELEVKDVVFEEEGGRTIASEYYLGGELVRRSVWHDMYAGQAVSTDSAVIGPAVVEQSDGE